MKFLLTCIILLFLFTNIINGQGCSDAGFCTVNSLKPQSGDNVKTHNNQIKIGAFYGNADKAITAYGSYIAYSKQFNEKFGLDFKLTSIAQNGNDILVFGLSDAFLTANYKASEKVKLILGTKIPLSNAGNSRNNRPLPMDYQPSLGTFDLIFGVAYKINKIQFAAAIQQPLSQNNNEFISNQYPENTELYSFQSTNKFIRSGDILLRISYPISLSQKFKLTTSILPIYHLANDKYTDEFNVEKEIIDSKGLTLNGNIYLDYELNSQNSIQVNMGMPFIVRDSRPDGLTRSFITNLEYRVKF